MDELLPIIRAELASIWRFRWWALGTAWAICGLGYIAVSLWPDSYEAEAVVYVDVKSRLDQALGGVAIEWNVQEQVERVKQMLLSRPVLETVARDTDLDLRATTPEAMSVLVSSLQQEIVVSEANIRRGLDPRFPQDTILRISYSDQNRDMALTVVDTLLKTFVRDVVRGGQGASDAARMFLLEQIAQYKRELAERELALAEFKRENVGLLPGEAGGDYFTRLQTSMEQLQQSEADLRTAVNRRDALRAQLGSENPQLPPDLEPQNGTSSSVPVSDTQARIAELEDQREQLLLRFTDNHPDVVATRQQLERLYAQRQEELASLAAAGGSEFEGSALSNSPVYQSIQIALNEAKVEVAAIESQIAEQSRRVADLKAKVDVMPEIEARLTSLTRDYDQMKMVHDELVGRLEQEKLGSAAVSDDVNFSVIQPPVADFTPVMPDRMLFLAFVFFGAVVGGAAVAYLLTLIRPVFARARALQEFAELPVLGTVSAMQSPTYRGLSRQVVAFVGLAAVLVVTFAALVTVREQAAAFAQRLWA
jgi:polysaccharide chain length determinant protein (PEP-CTERM system associated)